MIGKLECRVFAMNKAGKCNEKEKKGVVGVEGEGGIDAVVASYNSKHMNVQEHKKAADYNN
ncbi:hypothetical protein [Enterocloster bolteae]|uniref:hypothetical protein n=1 Tax=Enterocloster bolteae TaxID=208479 RepID=UPI002A8272C0|nr:hypothetical protein [Enterocloster bolteae]